MTRPDPDDADDEAIDVPQPEIDSSLDDNGDWTVAITFASGAEYSATSDTEAGAALMLGIGLASIAERDDAPADLVLWAGLIAVAYDGIAEAEAEAARRRQA